ncbi:hypothetical protein EI162_12730 [Psychrobacter sp. FME6]|nr:hypothetical protein [Psychrobacter sp. FME6]
MVKFIDNNKLEYGALAICRVLPIAPSTYYRAKDMECCPEKRSLRSQHDDYYISEIKRIWQD